MQSTNGQNAICTNIANIILLIISFVYAYLIYIYNYIYRVLLSSLAQEVQCVLQRPFSSPHNIKHDARCRSPISAGPTSGVLPAFSVLSALCESGQLGKCKHCWVQLRAPIKYLTTHEQYEQLYSAPIAVNNHEKYYSSLGVGI